MIRVILSFGVCMLVACTSAVRPATAQTGDLPPLAEPEGAPDGYLKYDPATPSEGKSVMVASLGRLLASNGKRVLLIDCDWRSPRLHQIFRISNRDGLASLLGDKEAQLDNVIHHDALSGVDVMPSGSVKTTQAERTRQGVRGVWGTAGLSVQLPSHVMIAVGYRGGLVESIMPTEMTPIDPMLDPADPATEPATPAAPSRLDISHNVTAAVGVSF